MWSFHDLTTSPPTGTKFTSKMPLTQEKRLDSNFSNNNDHSYLHKKFKKMASTLSVFPTNSSINEETRRIEPNLVQNDCSTSISNGSIAAAHPEIAKIKEKPNLYSVENNVQNTFNVDNSRLRDVNKVVQVTGQTSVNDEFSNKTETADFDFSRDGFTGGSGGRYICPYCKLSCAKPSVLQKHIRAHTNERPYPCVPCGFAFKTKSNLYKHRRSRTHALRLQGADICTSINEDEFSGGSESDTSTPPTSIPDNGSEINSSRIDNTHSVDFSLELSSENKTQISKLSSDNGKSKTIYKPKFRAAFYQENDEKERLKKTFSSNADFLTEHISKIISDNEAIVDVIESPLQKKYGKIKQIAESKQFLNEIDLKVEASPLNLTKNNSEMESSFRKRSHSESFFHGDYQKHPLNPEGSIIKDLLLKTKSNGLVTTELIESLGHLFICPHCNEIFKSADILEVHRTFHCKVNVANVNSVPKEVKHMRPDNVFVRSNSVNVRLPETSTSSYSISSPKPSPLRSKPDNLLIIKPETIDVITPLPSPGPLLGNTRLVDTRTSSEYMKKPDFIKKPTSSPKRRIDRADTYSPRLVENISPRSADMFQQAKLRCIEGSPGLRPLDDMSPHTRHNSLQMFGGEVKIFDHSGSSTTLRIEPSKNQLSPIMIQQTLSPSKLSTESEASSVVVRSGLHSGGTIMHNPPTPKEMMGTQTPRISTSNMPSLHNVTHFQFPPLSAITAYNPLTLPPLSPSSSPNGATTILHGGKLIPHVPGIPGPNTAVFVGKTTQQKTLACDVTKTVLSDNIRDKTMTINFGGITMSTTASKYDLSKTSKAQNNRAIHMEVVKQDPSPEPIKTESTQFNLPLIKIKHVDEPNHSSKSTSVTKATRQEGPVKRGLDGNPRFSTQKESVGHTTNKLKFKDKNNYISSSNKVLDLKPENEIRHFNFENLITKAEIFSNQIPSSPEVQKNTTVHEEVEMSAQNERSETLYFQKSITVKSGSEDRKPKFLRPSTLPLKPGTFTPKRHHGITPNANTMPLVSPETPRPAKAYGQLYLNGNAYTYLGLKCSTKVFYCTINRPQPTYVPNQHFLSMYSNWQLLSELTPDPLGLSASSAMSLYDSRHRPQSVVAAVIKQDLVLTHSSQWKNNSNENMQSQISFDNKILDDDKQLQCSDNVNPKKKLAGGFESNEEYTYVRGRGRGRYVCSECGIRCKKPSMLKKHIRTHTDVRPYTCIHCAFSFKTKGNLTKHMKSKAHYKKCCELGINPNEGSNDMDGSEMAQCSGETDDDTDSEGEEGNEGETESSDTEAYKSRLPEHEAAHCLLSLGGSRPATSATPGLITSARPSTYPYTPAALENLSFDINPECQMLRSNSTESGMDIDSEPMDLSKSDVKTTTSNIPEIPTARESSVLASLASNTAKLPQPQAQWANGEPMLHTYLTERALLDTKIKQSQHTSNLSKVKKIDMGKPVYTESDRVLESNDNKSTTIAKVNQFSKSNRTLITSFSDCDFGPKLNTIPKEEICTISETSTPIFNKDSSSPRTLGNTNAENAKHVVSEYLKQARMHHMKTSDDMQNHSENSCDNSHNLKIPFEESTNLDDLSTSETEGSKLPTLEHDPIARKVVIGVGGVAFKVTKGKEFENSANYSPGRLMEDGRRVCDFCNKTFTKPSQLRLHLNIHYMERPFRCSVCAVSFRTRGHLQKHERSGSHHNKVSMTSTFGAATSFNPRPFRCSDCNIAFRIHGHLAKHLRSKMHVMRLECLFKLPFGTFTEIERAGVSLTDIDTTDCASSLASLQALARELHEKDPTKLEYREPSGVPAGPACRESSEEEDAMASETCDSEKNCEIKTNECSEVLSKEVGVNYSATDN